MEKLKDKKCAPCEGEALPLDRGQAENYLKELGGGWEITDGKKIRKDFVFKNFAGALAFVNKVGAIAEAEGHHPDIHLVSYKKVIIELWTHAISGLSENDFILASKIEANSDSR